ncbi:MAG: glycine cleavage system aminomethyltransferase GcvT [Spirochaetia bacterium]|nr:glycine cleavage system aminomethyltransferase GcvT [Spirochaetia bacterium]
MKKTPLYEKHIELKARMVDFAGFDMPVMYAGIKDEYLAVRNNCGLFDISHMAPYLITGENPDELLLFLNHITCRDVTGLKPGKIQYNAITNSEGGLIDDITIYKIDLNRYILLVNASNSEPVYNHITGQKNKYASIKIEGYNDYVLLAFQGKNAEQILKKVISPVENNLESLFFYEFTLFTDYKVPHFLSRTGYSGEDGFEILMPSKDGIQLWNNLIKAGVTPCGLGARDILRMEVFYPLYGNELNSTRTPIESSIDWIVSSKKDYLGKHEIFKNPPSKKVTGFVMKGKGGLPRSHYPVVNKDGKVIGEVTSGAFSFTWDRGFGMAFIEIEYCKEGESIFIDIRGLKNEAIVHLKSPYQGSIKRRPKK